MNNLLMRELPLRCTIRLWDTYQVAGAELFEASCCSFTLLVFARLKLRASPTSTCTCVLPSSWSGASRSSP